MCLENHVKVEFVVTFSQFCKMDSHFNICGKITILDFFNQLGNSNISYAVQICNMYGIFKAKRLLFSFSFFLYLTLRVKKSNKDKTMSGFEYVTS